MRYIYLGDKLTRTDLRGLQCNPIRRYDGKCIVSVRMASAMVTFENGVVAVVARRRLRLISKQNLEITAR